MYATGEGRDAGESYQFPAVEVETGLLDNLAIFVAGARQVDDKKGESSSSGWGNADIGLKWRPFKKDGVFFSDCSDVFTIDQIIFRASGAD